MSDATSYVCKAEAQHQVAGACIKRAGRVLHKFLMEGGFLKSCSGTGEENATILASVPRLLTLGKVYMVSVHSHEAIHANDKRVET
jgi:hypothetical protein